MTRIAQLNDNTTTYRNVRATDYMTYLWEAMEGIESYGPYHFRDGIHIIFYVPDMRQPSMKFNQCIYNAISNIEKLNPDMTPRHKTFYGDCYAVAYKYTNKTCDDTWDDAKFVVDIPDDLFSIK